MRQSTPGAHRALARASVLAAVLAIGLAGCGSGEQQVTPKPATDPKPAPTSQAKMLTLGDIERRRADSPERALVQLWYWAQWGSAPNIVRGYAPAVRHVIGTRRIVGSFAQQRETLRLATLEIREASDTPGGKLITTVIKPPNGPELTDSWLLRENRGRWQVVHDTFLERAVDIYVQGAVIDSAGTGKEMERRAQRAGRRVAERYRNLFVTGSASRPRSTSPAPAATTPPPAE